MQTTIQTTMQTTTDQKIYNEILALKKDSDINGIVKLLERTMYDGYPASEYFAIYKILKPLMDNTQLLYTSTRISLLMKRVEPCVFANAMCRGDIADVVLFLDYNVEIYATKVLIESLINKKYAVTRYICECNRLNKYIDYQKVLNCLTSQAHNPVMFLYVFDICSACVSDDDIARAVRSLLFQYSNSSNKIDVRKLYINISTVLWYISLGSSKLKSEQEHYYDYKTAIQIFDGYAEKYFTKLAMLNFLVGTKADKNLLDTRKLLWELGQFVPSYYLNK